jgi:P22 coat protein - gene protein 5
MSNTTLTADVVAKLALPILENELGVVNTLYRAHEQEFANEVNGYKKGGSVRIRRPADFTLRTGATVVTQDVVEGYTTLTVDQQVGVDFQFTTSDLTLKESDLAERVIKPAMSIIANGMAKDVFTKMYQGTYNWVGTAGNTIDSFSDFAVPGAQMDRMAIPQSDRYAALHPSDYWGLAGAATALLNNKIVGDAWVEGSLGKIGGIDTMMSQVLPSHTNGTAATTNAVVSGNTQEVLYSTTAVNTSWTQTLVTKGWGSSSTILAGTVFAIANVYMVNPKTKATTSVLQQFVVTADVTANQTTTNTTGLVVSPPMIVTGPYQTVTYSGNLDTQVIVQVGSAGTTYRQNLFYHKNAMALAVVPMEMPQGAIGGARRSYKGLSVRVQPYYDGVNDVSKWRLDLLYGRALIDPRLAVRSSGT